MSSIRNKISSIEADDDVASKALGLRPAENSAPPDPVSKIDRDEPMPAIISRSRETDLTQEESESRWPLFLIITLGILWLIASLFIANGFFDLSNMAGYSPMQLGGLTMFVFFPLLLLGLLFFTLKQLSKVTQQANRLRVSADALIKVDDTVVRRATEMSGIIKGEITGLNAGIDTALTRAATLQGLLGEQMEKLGETSYAVEDKTKKITKRLATEREALWSISNTFDEQMKVLTETLDTHSENLAMSTKTAEQKIQEARVSIESTASKINTTSELVRSNTMEAASTLTDNQTEILRLSEQLKARAEELDTIYQKHGADLNAMIAQLRNEQEDLNQSLEERLGKMRDVALSAQVSAERLTEASHAGRETVMSLTQAAKLSESAIKQRFSDMEDMVKYSNTRAESISEKAARRVQDSLAQTRKEILRIESDMQGLQEKLAVTTAQPVRSEKINLNEDIAVEQVPTEEVPIEAPVSQEPAKSKSGFLNLRPAPSENKTNEAPKARLSGLRPAPDINTDLHFEASDIVTETPFEEEMTMPTPEPVNVEIDNGLLKPIQSAQKVEPQTAESNDDQLRRRITEPEPSGGWWKGIFARGDKAGEMSAIDAITQPSPVPEALTPPATTLQSESMAQSAPPAKTEALSHKDFMRTLERNGLGPNAIVDTGTIVEAVNARMHGGSKQMSIAVEKRLPEPVSHFSKLINSSEALKDHAINFAVKFHHSLTPLENNSEAIRSHLESEDGRLFLLCDAALNK